MRTLEVLLTSKAVFMTLNFQILKAIETWIDSFYKASENANETAIVEAEYTSAVIASRNFYWVRSTAENNLGKI